MGGDGEFNQPEHAVPLIHPFALSKSKVTFSEWNACAEFGDCDAAIYNALVEGRRPMVNVSWDDAQAYVVWLSKMTGQSYRLVTEAEWEYAARAGTTTAYYWGDEIGKNNADCDGCGSQWDNKETAPVGSFAPNKFGLYDMAGNAWEWVDDCWHDDYRGAPVDGSAWEPNDCADYHVVRGGSWYSPPELLRSATRLRSFNYRRDDNGLGFRIGRTLLPPAP
jgi:formylglycine-generating enzyme required for sulfatase activity